MSSTPSDRKYTKTHEWCLAKGDVVTIGITQFATDQLADITFVDLPAIGSQVIGGQTCGEIESVKATSELYSAVSGEVIEVNKTLGDSPELVNNDPYGQGWMVKIRATNLSELDALMDGSTYDQMLAAAS